MRGRNSEVTERKEKKVELLESTVQKIVVRAEMKMDLFGTRIDLEIEREREGSVCLSVRPYVCMFWRSVQGSRCLDTLAVETVMMLVK